MKRKAMFIKSVKFRAVVALLAVVTLMFVMAACGSKQTDDATDSTAISGRSSEPGTPSIAKNANGVWTAEAWKDLYPNQYATYMQNKMNSTAGSTDPYFEKRGDMVKMYGQLPVIWNNSPFSTFYNEPNGHNYSLEDIRATGRLRTGADGKGEYKETALANCFTCKSADFTSMIQKGNDPYAMTFKAMDDEGKINEPISCYNCHGNNLEKDAGVTSLEVTQPYFKDAMGSDAGKVDVGSQICGQCHNEYYFKNKVVTNPYTGLDQMDPVKMYNFYKTAGADGTAFVDYTNPLTNVGHLKAQHTEFEFVYGMKGSSMSQRINPQTNEKFTCADCHMGNTLVSEDGIEYTSHMLISPLDNPELLSTTCESNSACHGTVGLAAYVEEIQAEEKERVKTIGDKLVELNGKLATATTEGTLDESQLADVREFNREAQWYWDYVMVENSEGAHNPDLAWNTLDLSEKAVDAALAYF